MAEQINRREFQWEKNLIAGKIESNGKRIQWWMNPMAKRFHGKET